MPYQSNPYRERSAPPDVARSFQANKPSSSLIQRLLDGLPGIVAWCALIFCVLMALYMPVALLVIATSLAVYSTIRFCAATIANLVGLHRIQAHMTAIESGWFSISGSSYDAVMTADDVHHVVIIPNFNEPLALLHETLTALSACEGAKSQMTVVLAMEANEDDVVAKAQQLTVNYAECFANIYFTVHPVGLEGEIQCKSANQSWAARWARGQLVDGAGYDADCIVVTTMDADTRWHPFYFRELAQRFAQSKTRYDQFWQAPIRYHNNVWCVNPLLRLVNAYSSAFELAYLVAPWWMAMPNSSYSLSLRLLESVAYWDTDVIADEWHMYIKAFYARRGKVYIEPILLPFSAHAVAGDTILESVQNRYYQTLRHAWGSKEVGYAIYQMWRHPDVARWDALKLIMRVAHDVLLSGTGWIIVTFGSVLPMVIHPELFSSLLSEPLNAPFVFLFQLSILVVMLLGLVIWWYDLKVRPPRANAAMAFEYIWTFLGFVLLPVLTFVFVALPVIHAQTRLMLGMPLKFRVSRKL